MSKTARAKTRIPLKAMPLMFSAAALALAGCGPSREEELAKELAKARTEAEQAKAAQKQAEQQLAEAQAASRIIPIIAEDDSEFEDDNDTQNTDDAENGENGDGENGDQAEYAGDRQARSEVAPSPVFAERQHISSRTVE